MVTNHKQGIKTRCMTASLIKDVNTLNYPVLASAKLDGIRGLLEPSEVISRSGKPIPNKHIQKLLALNELAGLDGEIIVGLPTAKDCYLKTSSSVMSVEGTPDFTYYAFDIFTCDKSTTYKDRLSLLESGTYKLPDFVKVLEQRLINNVQELLAFEEEMLQQGYEGVMVRSINGLYKNGKSTLKEGHLLKLKRFLDSEAEVVGFEELMINNNPKEIDELGYTKRSSSINGLSNGNTLGALLVRDIYSNVSFDIGTGLDDITREYIWNNKELLTKQLIKYKYFPVGVKDKPRHPVFLGFRDKIDL